jgi:hypothetical protein
MACGLKSLNSAHLASPPCGPTTTCTTLLLSPHSLHARAVAADTDTIGPPCSRTVVLSLLDADIVAHGSAVYLARSCFHCHVGLCRQPHTDSLPRGTHLVSLALSLAVKGTRACRDHLGDHPGISPSNRLGWAIRTDHGAPHKPFLAILK